MKSLCLVLGVILTFSVDPDWNTVGSLALGCSLVLYAIKVSLQPVEVEVEVEVDMIEDGDVVTARESGENDQSVSGLSRGEKSLLVTTTTTSGAGLRDSKLVVSFEHVGVSHNVGSLGRVTTRSVTPDDDASRSRMGSSEDDELFQALMKTPMTPNAMVIDAQAFSKLRHVKSLRNSSNSYNAPEKMTWMKQLTIPITPATGIDPRRVSPMAMQNSLQEPLLSDGGPRP